MFIYIMYSTAYRMEEKRDIQPSKINLRMLSVQSDGGGVEWMREREKQNNITNPTNIRRIRNFMLKNILR
jgi:hypothetical protein